MKKDNQYKAILLIFIVITTPFAIWVRLDNAGYIFAGLFPLILFIIIVHHIIIIKAAVELNMILLILITQVLFVLSLLLSVDVNDSGRGGGISIYEFLYARGIEVSPPKWLLGITQIPFFAFILVDILLGVKLFKKIKS